MPHKETDELSKLFDVLYRIDQRVSGGEELQTNIKEEYGADTNKNTRRGDE